MEIRDTETYRELLEAQLAAHASKAVNLIVVSDIAEWERERGGFPAKSPIALAVIERPSGAWGILVQREIDENAVNGVLSRVSWDGRHKAAERLITPALFLRHLVLHELAHLENGWDQSHEDDCDDWAFERLAHAL